MLNKTDFDSFAKKRLEESLSDVADENDVLSGYRTNEAFVKLTPSQLISAELYKAMKNVFDAFNDDRQSEARKAIADTAKTLFLLDAALAEQEPAEEPVAEPVKDSKSKKSRGALEPVTTDTVPDTSLDIFA